MEGFSLIGYGITGFLIGGMVTMLFLRAGRRQARQQAENEQQSADRAMQLLLQEKQMRLDELKTEIRQLTDATDTLQHALRQETEKRATAEEKNSRIPLLEQRVQASETALAESIIENTTLTATISRLQTRLEDEQQQTKEKLALLDEAKNQLKLEFQNVANRIFETKSQKFTDQNKSNVETLLTPLREQLQNFKQRIEDVYDKESKDRVSLYNEITHLKALNQRISEDAINLTNALKGQSKTQGVWGEVILERLLEESGLHKGREYEAQAKYDSEAGQRRHPDVVVHLPEGKDIVIDSKVSLVAYEKYCAADTEEKRDKRLKEHLISLRTHIKTLSEKKYEALADINTLDFVLLFLPVEGAFWTAIEQEPGLFNEAFGKNIMLVGPSTLLATLRIIQNIWRHEDQNRNAQIIAKKAGDLYDKFVGFVGSLQDVGDKLGKARDAYDKAHRQLSSGKGNLVRRTEELKLLGVNAKKTLPPALLEQEI